MPTTNQVGSIEQYPKYPNLERDFGENPARFLSMSTMDTSLALIRGIQTEKRLNAWKAIELRDFDGREEILDAIEDRREELGGESE